MEESFHEIYSERQIQAGTILGGPIVAGYFFARNFRAFNEADKARNSLILSVIVTVLLFGGLMITPGAEKIPNAVIPIVNGVIALGLVRAFQSKSIREYTGPVHTWANTIFVSFGILVITLIPIVGIAYYSYAISTVTEKTYGRMQHDISFDKTNISEAEVDSIAAALRKGTFFDDEVKKSVDVRKVGDRYVLSLYCNDSIRAHPEAVKPFEELQRGMQASFPNNPITFELVVGTPDNVIKRIG
jgi:hypothetical protein